MSTMKSKIHYTIEELMDLIENPDSTPSQRKIFQNELRKLQAKRDKPSPFNWFGKSR